MRGAHSVMRALQMFICSVLFMLIFSFDAFPEVVVNDVIVPKGEKVMLRAETKSRLFSKGGEIVEFLVDGKSIGKVLSGGDGVAFKQFTPHKTGIHHLYARSGKDEGRGVLLSLKKGTGIVVVDVDGSILEKSFSRRPRSGSRKAIDEISRRSPVAFLSSGLLSIKMVKAFLRETEFKEAPVVPWEGGAAFEEIHERGFNLKAIIGGPQVIESSRKYQSGKYRSLAFSFEEAEGAIEVKNWDEIEKKLK